MLPLPRIPGYELLKRLGGGPLTCVFALRDGTKDQPCAIKMVREDWEDQATAIKLLQREARTGLLVRHPHLVRMVDAHVTRSPHFLVMELLPGQSLRRRLWRDSRLDVATTLWIARQVAEALAALHQAGFLHGDIKPENIRLVDDGTAILIDLGFSQRPEEQAQLAMAGYVLGTPNYLAPESCGTAGEADLNSDLFSLGVMLFEMLTGRLPYPAGTVSQTIRRHACEPPADLRSHARSIPPALADLVDRLLARRPADRPRAAAVVGQLINLEITAFRQRRSA